MNWLRKTNWKSVVVGFTIYVVLYLATPMLDWWLRLLLAIVGQIIVQSIYEWAFSERKAKPEPEQEYERDEIF